MSARCTAGALNIFQWPKKRLLLIRGCIVIMAGFLVHLTLGTFYSFGNILPYLVSYIRQRSHPADVSEGAGTWIVALSGVGQGTMFFGGWLESKIGPRFTTLVGSCLLTAGILLSYFAIKVSFWFLLLTYGLIVGLGMGIAYVGPLSCAMRWMPRWKGVAGGFIVAGYGLGALIFNQVQTYYINPQNLKTTDGYFTDSDLLDRVPFVFLVLGGIYAVMQFIGSVLIANPPHDYEKLHDTQQPSSPSEQHQMVVNNADYRLINGEVFPSDDQEVSPTPPTEVTSVHPFQMLRTLSFYHLWSMMLMAGFTVSFIATLFKVFGLTFIDDDQFLATVGSMSAIFNCAGRIVWGLVADKFSYRFAHISKSGIMTISLLTFYATSAVGKPMFFIWVCVIFFCVGGIFSIYPTSIAHTFGPKYMSINYGLLFTSQACSGVIAAVLFTTLLDLLEWNGMIFLISGFSTMEFVLALLYYYEQHCRRPPEHSHQSGEQ